MQKTMIFGLILSCMFIAGCGDDNKKTNQTTNTTMEITQENLEKAAKTTNEEKKSSPIQTEANASVAQEEKTTSLEPAENLTADETNATQKAPEASTEAAANVENNATQTPADNNASETSSNVVFPGNKTVTEYYAMKCRVCHGAKAEKNTMDPTYRVMAGLPKDELYNAMIAYQNGGGGKLKATMLGQIKALNNEQIEALAELISKF